MKQHSRKTLLLDQDPTPTLHEPPTTCSPVPPIHHSHSRPLLSLKSHSQIPIFLSMKPHSRKTLLDHDPTRTLHDPPTTYPPAHPIHPTNASSSVRKTPYRPGSTFDSSMALTVLVLLTALFFMGFFSFYIRRFADHNSVDLSRRRNRHHSASPTRPAASKGLDPSAVRSLPLISYCGDAKDPAECPVCLGEFEQKEPVKVIPYCRHVFHPYCIDTWLSAHASCPLCRTIRLFQKRASKSGVQEKKDTVGVPGLDERSTAGMRRTSSSSSMGGRAVSLHRSLSF